MVAKWPQVVPVGEEPGTGPQGACSHHPFCAPQEEGQHWLKEL